jgi:hypothetical protein
MNADEGQHYFAPCMPKSYQFLMMGMETMCEIFTIFNEPTWLMT